MSAECSDSSLFRVAIAVGGLPDDRELMPESKNLCLQNGAGSETISQRKQQTQHGLGRLHVAALQMQRFQ